MARHRTGYRTAVGIVFFLLTVGAAVAGAAEISYGMQKRNYFEGKADELERILEEEKTWIRRNQGENGEIYLNIPEGTDERGTVNPYFACQAAMGLLTGDVTQEDLDCTASYLSWHADRLVETGGIVSDYKYIDGKLQAKGTYDSVDSYLAVFLTLFADYVGKGGEPSAITNCRQAVTVCADKLKELTGEGLTSVSEENKVAYLMDNAEVCEAYRRMADLFTSDPPSLKQWENRKTLEEYFSNAAESSRSAVYEKLWNNRESRYEIGLNGDGGVLNHTGWSDFYPDGVAQVYPIACGLLPPENINGRLYRDFCDHYDWEYLFLEGETYDWPVLSYIAVQMGDVSRAETYLGKYHLKYSVNRNYPLHTADAGWAARACDALISYYEEQEKTGLLQDLFERWKGSR